MDTRSKIIPAEQAVQIAASGAIVVSGYFDPLIADHADRLRGLKQAGRILLVAIASPEDVILPPRARAELVAALACVDHVTELTPELTVEVHLEDGDGAAKQRLIDHVHRRQQAAAQQQ